MRVADDAPAGITNTATVAGGGELNTANDTARDVAAITQVADLTITVSHSGNFTTANKGTYAITVSNNGGAATTGAVTVIDKLPAGLTYAGPASVNGWTVSVNGQTITATRGEALAGGSSYQALTLTVQVAGNAPAGVTNTVSLSGGGEVNFASDVAADVTAILPGEQIRRRRGA